MALDLGGGALPPPPAAAPAASHLWRYDSPLLRHLSSTTEPEAAAPPLPPYQRLKARAAAAEAAEGAAVELPRGELTHFKSLLRHFQQSGTVKDQALALYVNSKVRRQCCMQRGLHERPGGKQRRARCGTAAMRCRPCAAACSAVVAMDGCITPSWTLHHMSALRHPSLQLYAEAMPQFQLWLLAGMDEELRVALRHLKVRCWAAGAAVLAGAAAASTDSWVAYAAAQQATVPAAQSGLRRLVAASCPLSAHRARRRGRAARRRCSLTLPSLYLSGTWGTSRRTGRGGGHLQYPAPALPCACACARAPAVPPCVCTTLVCGLRSHGPAPSWAPPHIPSCPSPLLLCAPHRDMVQTVDMRNPWQWFPTARALQRRCAARGACAAATRCPRLPLHASQ